MNLLMLTNRLILTPGAEYRLVRGRVYRLPGACARFLILRGEAKALPLCD
jgi:hypothetical protein